MYVNNPLQHKSKGFFQNSTIVIIAFATAFFPRVLEMAKAPSLVNFIHFAAVPLACGVVLTTTRSKDRQQILLSKAILLALSVLLTIEIASAFINNAGIINVILSFLLLGEPFILLLAIVTISMSLERLKRFRAWILTFGFFNLWFALVQKFFLNWDTCNCSPGGWGDGDAIKGVFIDQGSGHVVGASVSVSFAAYYFVTAKNRAIWLRMMIVIASIVHIVVSDAKQVIVTLIVAGVILCLTNIKDIKRLFLYLTSIIIFLIGFIWAMYNIEAMSAFQTWIVPEFYGSDGDATRLKFAGIRIIINHFYSPLNYWLGLGPGHTIDRLGGWMLRDYKDLLSPLGATISPIGNTVWLVTAANPLGDKSSMFSAFWGWSAIWGDLGFLGLGAYLYLCSLMWLFSDDLSRFLMLTVMVHGFIFTQMQEPGYMLFIACLIGLRWQELISSRVNQP